MGKLRNSASGRLGPIILIALLAVATQTNAESRSTENPDRALNPARVGWFAIQVKARKFFLSMKADISVSHIDDETLQGILIDPGEGVPVEPSQPVNELIVGMRGAGRRHETRLYLNAETGAAVQRISHDSRGRLRHRIYRFTDIGAYQRSWWPVGAEEERLPPERWPEWSDRSEDLRAYTVKPAGAIVTEPSGLLYIISAAPLSEPGDHFEIVAYMRGHVFPVHVQVIGREDIRVQYEDRSGQSVVQQSGKRPAIKLLLTGEVDENGENRFELLGMRGNIVMHIDPDTRAPLQIEGKMKIVGKVKMRTRRLTRRTNGA